MSTYQLQLRNLVPLVALFLLPFLTTASPGCPFCDNQGTTLAGEIEQADFVIYVSIKEARQDARGGDFDGATDVTIEAVVKDHQVRDGKKVITLPRYIPDLTKGQHRYLLYCSVIKGKLDPYKGVALRADSDVAKYLKGSLELKDASVEKRLRFAFEYLDNPEFEISHDAYKEFANADYKDYAVMAKDLSADRIAKWLKDPNTSPTRYGLYGSMLGHCGKKEHADLLRKLVSDPEKRALNGVDGILAGYIMLEPKVGWEYIRGVLGNRHEDFMFRYAALRCVRFFHDSRADIVSREQLVAGVVPMIRHKDIADLAIEDLRKWQRWEVLPQILGLSERRVFGLYPQPAFEVGVVRRAVLRFALACKGNPQAMVYVDQQRKKNREAVESAEELLRLEMMPGK